MHLAILKYSIGIIVFVVLTCILLMPFLLLTYINYKTIIGFFLFIFIYYLVFILRNDLKYDKYYAKIWEYKSKFEEKSTKVPLKNIINHIEVTGNKVVLPPLNEIENTYYYDSCLSYNYGNTNKRMIFMLIGNHLWENMNSLQKIVLVILLIILNINCNYQNLKRGEFNNDKKRTLSFY